MQRELLKENGLMMAIIDKNNTIMNQSQLIETQNKKISDLEGHIQELEKGRE